MTRVNWGQIREQLWDRCGGVCEVSGLTLDPDTFDAHHRRPKGMGGTSRPDRDWLTNLLALDPLVHNGGPQSVHGNPDWSRPLGYLVYKDEPWAGNVPVRIKDGPWVLLGRDGRYYDWVE